MSIRRRLRERHLHHRELLDRLLLPVTSVEQNPDSSFTLSKWYLDAIGDDGDVLIAYAAEVRWRALAIRYTSTLVQRAGSETRVRATLRRADSPSFSDGALTWASPALEVAGRWKPLESEARDTILARDEGRVEWRCHVPRARAEIEIAGEPPIRGLGYAEHLTLTLAPWRLPIDELWWGRFLSEDASLVWIDWRGPHSHQLVLLDGCAIGPARIDENGLTAEDGSMSLALESPRVLREGALGKTALSILPAVETVLPVRILATEETKWAARGTLHRGSSTTRGWAIHEVVRWPC